MVIPSRTHGDYTVACICPMGVELTPVLAILDEKHDRLPMRRNQNAYVLGKMGHHNIVVATMPDTGNNSAATVTTQLQNDFTLIRFGVLVGTGEGIPGREKGYLVERRAVIHDWETS